MDNREETMSDLKGNNKLSKSTFILFAKSLASNRLTFR